MNFMEGLCEAIDIRLSGEFTRRKRRVQFPNLSEITRFGEVFDPIVFAAIAQSPAEGVKSVCEVGKVRAAVQKPTTVAAG